MSAALRSVFVVNRTSLMGTAVILALAAALLTATGSWLDAGIRDEKLALVVALASSFAGTVVLITVFIVSSIFSSALRQRRREFALLRAIGATATKVRSTVTAEALVILLIAAPVGVAIGTLIAPLAVPLLRSSVAIPEGFVLPFSPISLGATLVILVPTSLLAAFGAARGILRVSPTVAVRESTVDAPTTSRARLRTAAILATTAVLAAATPFFLPGLIGSASGATSAILLVIAAALAGPALVHRASTRAMALVDTSTGAARVLAFANARGFSRRLSAAVIPLALLVALGTVQSGVDSAVLQSTANELSAGVHADLVIQSASTITAQQTAAIAALPGVSAMTASGHLAAAVLIDPEGGWEQSTVSSITAGTPLIDPVVSSGSLSALTTPATIAVSRTTLLFTGKSVGDTIGLRLSGDRATTVRIVAAYERGLAFGDYIVGAGTSAPAFDTVFLDATAASHPATRTALAGMGLTVTDSAGYARSATESSGGQQHLSLVLLIALLGFVAAAAANTLAMSTTSRRDEFTLLKRIGATRAQVMRMVAIETGFIVFTALTIGILAVLPALIGVGQGMLGVPIPVFDIPVTVALAVSTVLITVFTVIPAAWLATSARQSRRT